MNFFGANVGSGGIITKSTNMKDNVLVHTPCIEEI